MCPVLATGGKQHGTEKQKTLFLHEKALQLVFCFLTFLPF
jgi:hypothetical protein